METQTFIRPLAKTKTRAIPEPFENQERVSLGNAPMGFSLGLTQQPAPRRFLVARSVELRSEESDGGAPPDDREWADFTKAQGASNMGLTHALAKWVPQAET